MSYKSNINITNINMLPENSSLVSEVVASQTILVCGTELRPQGVLDDVAATVSSCFACQFQTSIKLDVQRTRTIASTCTRYTVSRVSVLVSFYVRTTKLVCVMDLNRLDRKFEARNN